MTARIQRALMAATLIVAVAPAIASAGAITGINLSSLPGASTGTIGPLGAPSAPNNDNASGASPNTIAYAIFVNSPGFLEVEFNVADSGGTTEYRLPQTLFNLSGAAWSGFRFELGFGTGDGFVRSGLADGLDFDTPDVDPAPSATFFTTFEHQPDLMRWSGGAVPLVAPAIFSFAVDVPDGLATANPSGVSRFTLRQTPETVADVPGPAALSLFGAGLVGVAIRRRHAGHARRRLADDAEE